MDNITKLYNFFNYAKIQHLVSDELFDIGFSVPYIDKYTAKICEIEQNLPTKEQLERLQKLGYIEYHKNLQNPQKDIARITNEGTNYLMSCGVDLNNIVLQNEYKPYGIEGLDFENIPPAYSFATRNKSIYMDKYVAKMCQLRDLEPNKNNFKELHKLGYAELKMGYINHKLKILVHTTLNGLAWLKMRNVQDYQLNLFEK